MTAASIVKRKTHHWHYWMQQFPPHNSLTEDSPNQSLLTLSSLTDYQPSSSTAFLLTDYQPLLVLLSYWLIINLYLYYFPTDWLSTFNFYYFPTDWSSAFNFYYFPQLLLLFTNWHFCFGCWIKVTSKPALLCEFYRYMSLVVHLPVFSCSSQTCDHHQCWSAQMSRIHCKTNKFFIKSHTDTDTYMHACTHTIYNEMCHGNVYMIKALPKAHCSLVNN